MHKMDQIFTMDVDNEFGVLTRITALIRRSGLNIKGLAVAETVSPHISRLTVSVEMQGVMIDQIVSRLKSLGCVRHLSVYSGETHVKRELAVVICSDNSRLAEERKILFKEDNRVCFEFAATPNEIDDFVREYASEILDISRSGVVAIEKKGGGSLSED